MTIHTEPSPGVNGQEERSTEFSLLGFPAERYPTGWFQVAWSDELAAGDIRGLDYFGEKLVLWRGESGQVQALDAYCLHNGANLAVQGTVCNDEIVCPWHGWQWDGQGNNTCIPYGRQPCKPNLKMQSWPAEEYYGAIMVWHDRAGRPPLWDLPRYEEFESPEFYEPGPDMRWQWRIKAHVQHPGENAADFAHLKYVHGAEEPPVMREVRYKDHTFSCDNELTYGGGKRSTWLTPTGPTAVILEQGLSGLGVGFSRWPAPLTRALMRLHPTPIDDTYCDLFVSMTVERTPGEDRPSGRARQFVDHQIRTVQQDFFTWEHMKILDKSNLIPEETKTWSLFRRWASQFYPGRYAQGGGGQGIDVVVSRFNQDDEEWSER